MISSISVSMKMKKLSTNFPSSSIAFEYATYVPIRNPPITQIY